VVQAEQLGDLLKGSSVSLESPESVQVSLLPGQTLKQIAERAVEAAEKQAIRSVLKSTGGNKSKAAKILKTDYKTLHLKVKKYGLKASEE
jgi:DNA-binding NtrC family response regulator